MKGNSGGRDCLWVARGDGGGYEPSFMMRRALRRWQTLALAGLVLISLMQAAGLRGRGIHNNDFKALGHFLRDQRFHALGKPAPPVENRQIHGYPNRHLTSLSFS